MIESPGMSGVKYFFSKRSGVRKKLKGKFVYIFLDYDGTLAPIADKPGKAFIPGKTRKILKGLSALGSCKIAVVSGRALRDLENRVGLKNVVYVGNHGFEIKGPKIRFKIPVSRKYKKMLKEIKARLKKDLAPFKGVFIEDKGYCLAVHYRLADKNAISAIASKFYFATFIDEFRNNIRVKSGKMTREVRPPFIWNKGMAVVWLLGKETEAFPVYIGDDLTDEDAFQALRNKGLTIFVGKPKNTKARFYLKDTADVEKFLELVLRSKS